MRARKRRHGGVLKGLFQWASENRILQVVEETVTSVSYREIDKRSRPTETFGSPYSLSNMFPNAVSLDAPYA